MKKIITSLLILYSFTSVFAQKNSDYQSLIEKAQRYCYQNLDSALVAANQALVVSNQHNSEVHQAQRTIGLIYENNNLFDQARNAYAKAMDIAITQKNIELQLVSYTDWAIIHKKLGQYKVAQEYHLKTVSEAQKIGNWEMVEEGYHGLGTMFSMMSDFEQAVKAYYKSIEAAEKWGNKKGVVLTQQNISNIYFKAKNYELAKKNIQLTYGMALLQGDSLRIASVLNIYGNIEAALKNYERALTKHLEASIIFKKFNEKPRYAESLMAIGEIYYQQQKYNEAESFYNECFPLKSYLSLYACAKFYKELGKLYQVQFRFPEAITAFKESLQKTDSIGFKDIARENHLALAKIFHAQKDFESAFIHISEANRLGESLFEEDKQKNLTEAQFRFDVEKRDLQISAQEKDLRFARWVRYGLLIGLLLVSVLLFFTWRQMKQKQATSQRLALLMKELHHRVKNNLQTVVSLLRLQARKITDPTSLSLINESRDRLEAIAMLHQQFYKNGDLETVSFGTFLNELMPKLAAANNLFDDDFETEIDVENKLLNVDTSLPIALIINELVSNSFKHAFKNTQKPKIIIHLKNNTLLYKDNGKGLNPEQLTNNKEFFGIMLISSLVKQLKNTYTISNDGGMKFEMNLR